MCFVLQPKRGRSKEGRAGGRACFAALGKGTLTRAALYRRRQSRRGSTGAPAWAQHPVPASAFRAHRGLLPRWATATRHGPGPAMGGGAVGGASLDFLIPHRGAVRAKGQRGPCLTRAAQKASPCSSCEGCETHTGRIGEEAAASAAPRVVCVPTGLTIGWRCHRSRRVRCVCGVCNGEERPGQGPSSRAWALAGCKRDRRRSRQGRARARRGQPSRRRGGEAGEGGSGHEGAWQGGGSRRGREA